MVIDGLNKSDVEAIFKAIHFHETNQKLFDVPLYCKAIKNMTPKKSHNPEVSTANDDDLLNEAAGDVVDKHAPLKVLHNRSNYVPYINIELKTLLNSL